MIPRDALPSIYTSEADYIENHIGDELAGKLVTRAIRAISDWRNIPPNLESPDIIAVEDVVRSLRPKRTAKSNPQVAKSDAEKKPKTGGGYIFILNFSIQIIDTTLYF